MTRPQPVAETIQDLPATERVINGMHELTVDVSASPLANADILPVPVKDRTWNMRHLASLWVGIAVCIPTYMLAAGLIASGMNWREALLTILLGNAIVLVPLILNAHPGTKYGIPFPVLIRSSFGTIGAHIPSLLRGLVACGWFGIQTWIGGKAIYELARVLYPGIAGWWADLAASFVGINGGELACFLLFWLVQMVIVWFGTESIKWVEALAAPALIAVAVALFFWAINAGGGLGAVLDNSDMFTRPTMTVSAAGDVITAELDPLRDRAGVVRADRMRGVAVAPGADPTTVNSALTRGAWQPFTPELTLPWPAGADRAKVVVEIALAGREAAANRLEGSVGRRPAAPAGSWLLTVFFPLLTAMVGFWATLSLNIPDFTRYAKSQRDQMLGQAIGLPTTMTLYAFVGVVATCASLSAFPEMLAQEAAPWDPVALLAHFHTPLLVIVSMLILAIATLTTNIAANVVAPANGFSNLAPRAITFRTGGMITGLIGVLIMPWKLLASAGAYIFTWLIGYSALMGGIAGVMIADYYVVRRRRLDLAGLYRPDGPYRFTGGVNRVAVIAFLLGVLPNIPGFFAQAGIVPAELVPPFFQMVYTYAWFVGFGISFILYAFWMPAKLRAARQRS